MESGDLQRARKYLLPRERVIEVVQWHAIRLARPVAIAVALLAPLVIVAANTPVDSDALPVSLALIAAVLGWLAWQVFEWYVERLIVTDRRIMLVTGLLNRRVAMMPLRKVTDMTFERSFWGRLLGRWGWGTFVLESAGQDQALHRISPLPHPEALYRCVSEEIFYGSSRGAPSDADDGTGSGDEDGAATAPGRGPGRTEDDAPGIIVADIEETGPIVQPWWEGAELTDRSLDDERPGQDDYADEPGDTGPDRGGTQ